MSVDRGSVAPLSSARPLRSLDIGESFNASLDLYRRTALAASGLAAITVVPTAVLWLVVRLATLPSGLFVHDGKLYTDTGQTTSTASNVLTIVIALVGVLTELLAMGAVFKLQLERYLGRELDLMDALRFACARHRVLSLLWISVIAAVMIGVGIILLVLPGIWLWVSVVVAVPVLIFEQQTGMRAISRSMSLVSGRWWQTLGRLVIAIVLYVVLLIGFSLALGVIDRAVTSVTLFYVLPALLGALLSIVALPLLAAFVNVTYIDLRLRREQNPPGLAVASTE